MKEDMLHVNMIYLINETKVACKFIIPQKAEHFLLSFLCWGSDR